MRNNKTYLRTEEQKVSFEENQWENKEENENEKRLLGNRNHSCGLGQTAALGTSPRFFSGHDSQNSQAETPFPGSMMLRRSSAEVDSMFFPMILAPAFFLLVILRLCYRLNKK